MKRERPNPAALRSSPAAPLALVAVPDEDGNSRDNDCDGGEQRPLPVLCVAPRLGRLPAVASLPVVLLGGGQAMLIADVTPERRRELQRLVYEASRPVERDETTCDTPEKVRSAACALLRGIARRPGTSGLHLAGRLFVEHGDAARRVLAREWTPEWTSPRAKVDGLLALAGVPAADTLPGLAD